MKPTPSQKRRKRRQSEETAAATNNVAEMPSDVDESPAKEKKKRKLTHAEGSNIQTNGNAKEGKLIS